MATRKHNGRTAPRAELTRVQAGSACMAMSHDGRIIDVRLSGVITDRSLETLACSLQQHMAARAETFAGVVRLTGSVNAFSDGALLEAGERCRLPMGWICRADEEPRFAHLSWLAAGRGLHRRWFTDTEAARAWATAFERAQEPTAGV